MQCSWEGNWGFSIALAVLADSVVYPLTGTTVLQVVWHLMLIAC